ncbi:MULTISPECIES: choice-of-anchor E domain-containing protein [unclassified Nostoc]|uniref:choice-of-anchor E domain-containing protein n=1 Tax=unclassified Nostoc TaxID=2593658 RepID=UPI0013D1A404|nr:MULTISPECIES: choice-of-anchor E domain-containing protein [unclassified Nostoc]MBE8997377.1 choice-of-anchor E domain-containing protein [Nostoc sp. LEGE 12447]NEU78360.1 choice-of-anchor E domain-containing protein [Nostoc sp. UIC 10630]
MTTKLLNTLAVATTLVGIVATSGAANAASLSYTSSSNYEFTDIIDTPLSVQQFNSSLGTLQGVTIEFTGDILGNAGFENRSPTPSQTTVKLDSQFSLQLNNQSLLALNPQYTSSYQVAKYDNITDYSGTSGKTLSNLTATQSGIQTFTDTQFLQSFIGNGNIDFLFSAIANSLVTGSGNIRSYIDTYAKAGIKVTYNYDDVKSVPEPSATLGVALIAGLCLLSQSKKSWNKG